MKKMKLKLAGKETLSKDQMKKVSGGNNCNYEMQCDPGIPVWQCYDYSGWCAEGVFICSISNPYGPGGLCARVN